jgi:hypothetical protein
VVPSAAGTTISPSIIALPAPMCTFIATPGVDAHLDMLPVGAHPVAVEIDFVKPAGACRTFSVEEARAGLKNPGRGALEPMAAGLLRWKAVV